MNIACIRIELPVAGTGILLLVAYVFVELIRTCSYSTSKDIDSAGHTC